MMRVWLAYFSHLHTSSQHDYSFNLVLIHHPPEVLYRLFQRTFINFFKMDSNMGTTLLTYLVLQCTVLSCDIPIKYMYRCVTAAIYQ